MRFAEEIKKSVASLGKRVGAAKRRKHGFVAIPVEVADIVHKALASQIKAEYQRDYQKL